MPRVALVGNPNVGKTTLFNALTGGRQQVANWPGVTVVRHEGVCEYADQKWSVIDLPGTYSLLQEGESAPVDTRLTCDYLFEQCPDVLVNVIDAAHCERHLYLTMQLLELGVPMVLVLNMMDEAERAGWVIDAAELSRQLGCPVVTTIAEHQEGILPLQEQISRLLQSRQTPRAIELPAALNQAVQQLVSCWPAMRSQSEMRQSAYALRLLAGDCVLQQQIPMALRRQLPDVAQALARAMGEEVDVLIADRYYQRVAHLMQVALVRHRVGGAVRGWAQRLDRWVLHRWLGVPLFLLVMYGLFVVTMGVGGIFQDFFDFGSESLLVMAWSELLRAWHAPAWLLWILPQGVGRGFNTVLAFIPVLAALFFTLSVLDQSGYMARAAVVVDRLMARIGLPGKSFVPMIVAFGCNVPAVMATRSLGHQRDRIVTMLMIPFMSCGARLAIFAVFASVFFRQHAAALIFFLYFFGVCIAVLTGWVLHRTLHRGQATPLVMELPPYRRPNLQRAVANSSWRLRRFLWRAIKVVVPVCVLMSVLGHADMHGRAAHGTHHTALAQIGQQVTVVFEPMGITPHNWPATVGLMSGFMAKEVVIGTLNTMYSQLHGRTQTELEALSDNQWPLLWRSAWSSIGDHLLRLPLLLTHPLQETAPMQQHLDLGSTSEMVKRFGGIAAALAYLLFVLLYFPCVSTVAAMSREMYRGWAYFSVVWSFNIAYWVAVLFYQTVTWQVHSMQTLLWWCAGVLWFSAWWLVLRWAGFRRASGVSNEEALAC